MAAAVTLPLQFTDALRTDSILQTHCNNPFAEADASSGQEGTAVWRRAWVLFWIVINWDAPARSLPSM